MGRGSTGGQGGELARHIATTNAGGSPQQMGGKGIVPAAASAFQQAQGDRRFAVQPRNDPMPTLSEVRPQPDVVQPPQLTHAVYPTSGPQPQPQPQPVSPFETYRSFMGQTGRGYSDNFNRDFYTGFNRPPPVDLTGLVRRQPVQPFQPAQPEFDANTTQAEFDRARGITPAVQSNQMMQPQFMGGKGGGFGGGFNPYSGGFSPMGGKGGFGGFNPYAQRFFKDGGEVK